MSTVDSETFLFESDGLKLNVFVARPEMEGRFPLVFINHGGGGMSSVYNDLCLRLAAQGYVGVCMTFRGYYPSEGKQEYGKGEVVDILNLLEYFKEKDYVDNTRIGAMGYSRGGLNLLIAETRCEDFCAIVLWSTPVDMFEHFNNHPALLMSTIGGTPDDIPEEYEIRSPVYYAEKISSPLLIIHGEDDFVVPPWHSYELSEKLKKNNKEFKFKIIPGEGHNFTEFGFQAAWQETFSFLHEYLAIKK